MFNIIHIAKNKYDHKNADEKSRKRFGKKELMK